MEMSSLQWIITDAIIQYNLKHQPDKDAFDVDRTMTGEIESAILRNFKVEKKKN